MTRFLTALGGVVAIADGMGGHKGGAWAARIVVAAIQSSLEQASSEATLEETLQSAVTNANEAVHHRSRKGEEGLHNMGSTLVMVLLTPSGDELALRVAHVGDSRAYLLRDGELQRITRDHSVLEELIEMGVPADEAATKPHRDQLTHAIGPKPQVQARISEPIPMHRGDQALMCSDGLYSLLEPGSISGVSSHAIAVAEKAQRLVDMALAAGGDDNISVQVIECHGESVPDRATVHIPAFRTPEALLQEAQDAASELAGLERGPGWWVWIGISLLLAAALGAWSWGTFSARGPAGVHRQTLEETTPEAAARPEQKTSEPTPPAEASQAQPSLGCMVSIECWDGCAT